MGTTRVRRVRLLCGVLAIVAGCFPPPLDQSDVADTETQNGPNACGGLGALTPGEPGLACGPCLDGELVCDPSDPDKTRTVCEGDSARNACNGCEPLEEMPGANCGRCGQVVCDGTTGTTCAEPATCDEPLTCADLRCVDERRTCTESDGQIDARCGECIETHVQIDGACLGESQAPADVTATTDLDDRVVISWSATQHATAYRVFRCPGECDDRGPWTDLLGTAVTNTSVPDQTVTAPPAPPAPTVTASTDRTSEVSVTWSTVTAPASPRFTYRVIAVAPAGESAPSQTAVGRLADRAITGYELKVESGSWQPVEGFALTDTAAPAPTLVPGTVNATQGLHPDKVVLALTGWASTPGAERTYQVRARTRFGFGEEGEATGRRRAGPVTLTWERSAGSGPQDFGPITGASGPVGTGTHEDTDPAGIPPFGVVRHYRARLEAGGAAPVTTGSVAGWRTPLPGVPQIASVSTTLTTRVEVGWSPIESALAYHVYRDGVRLTPPTGVSCETAPCLFVDEDATAPAAWQAPTDVTASTDRTSGVTVTWSLPGPPATTSHRYELSALNPAGESARSPEVIGWRGYPPLAGVEVRATTTQTQTFTLGIQATSLDHESAPLASFSAATLTASQGEYRARVALELEGGIVIPAPEVTYAVRAVFAGGATPWSSMTSGRRAVGPVSRLWEYATDMAPETWITIPPETCAPTATECNDAHASRLGLERRYRITLTAPGTIVLTTTPVRGWRLAFSRVSGGFYSMCAVDTQGRLWTWGRYRETGGANPDANEWFGSLLPRVRDQGPFTHCAVGGSVGDPIVAPIPVAFGCGVSDSGPPRCGSFVDDTPLVELSDLAPGVRSLSIGGLAACAVLSNGQAKCWGQGFMLGDLQGERNLTPVSVRLASGEPITGLSEVSVGGGHACSRSVDGRIWCWGENDFGELGLETGGVQLHASVIATIDGARTVGAGGDHTCVAIQAGQIVCFGQNGQGQLGDGTESSRARPGTVLLTTLPDAPLTDAIELLTVGAISCARRSLDVRCWGYGWDGRLGDGTFDNVASLPRMVGLPHPATSLGGGGSTACAIVDGSIWCWGTGHLGDGTTTPRATPGEVTLP